MTESEVDHLREDCAKMFRAMQRLRAVNARLLEACKAARVVMSTEGENDLDEWRDTLAKVEAAIAAAEAGPR